MLTKHLAEDRGFNASTLAFSSMGFVGFLTLIVLVFYMISYGLNINLLLVGFFGSIINTLGIVCISNANANGPAGPA